MGSYSSHQPAVSSNDDFNISAMRTRKSRRLIDKIRTSRQSSRTDLISQTFAIDPNIIAQNQNRDQSADVGEL